jgi:hypothetical protein
MLCVAKASADQTVATICQEALRGAAVTMASVLAARRCVESSQWRDVPTQVKLLEPRSDN